MAKAKTPEPPLGFKGRQRTMAMILHAVLSNAGYDVGYPPEATKRALVIGLSEGKVVVSTTSPPKKHATAKADAERCVSTINNTLGTVTRSARDLASYRYVRTSLGVGGPWHDVMVECPGVLTLHKLQTYLVAK